uniref:Uncharacterized protein n=1 Tax=Eutreptiella gymnastica TaxID=73025 RepID=A0A7S1NET5_9EUGL|mmetsp:Transcript_24613/g.44665  ORF Transcript_24613/g.44665 Transcript_24613/m.44665 type:complete len:500 (+) Transcript_24613:105-1604(+)
MVSDSSRPAAAQSPRELYALKCVENGCKKNSLLMKSLPSLARWDLLTELDLNLNFVGSLGIRPVLEVVRRSPNVSKLCLADNFLTNDSVKDIVTQLMNHPKLSHLDLRKNPISHAGGKMLSQFATESPALHTVLLDDTLINPALVRIIQKKATEKLADCGAATREYTADAVHGAAPLPPVLAPQVTFSPAAPQPRDAVQHAMVCSPASCDPSKEQHKEAKNEERAPNYGSLSSHDSRNGLHGFGWSQFMKHAANISEHLLVGLNSLTEALGHNGVPMTHERRHPGDGPSATEKAYHQGSPLLHEVTKIPRSPNSPGVPVQGLYLNGLDCVIRAMEQAQGQGSVMECSGLAFFCELAARLTPGVFQPLQPIQPTEEVNREVNSSLALCATEDGPLLFLRSMLSSVPPDCTEYPSLNMINQLVSTKKPSTLIHDIHEACPDMDGLRLLAGATRQQQEPKPNAESQWYAMDLVWSLVQDEKPDGPDGENSFIGLGHVMSLIQ